MNWVHGGNYGPEASSAAAPARPDLRASVSIPRPSAPDVATSRDRAVEEPDPRILVPPPEAVESPPIVRALASDETSSGRMPR